MGRLIDLTGTCFGSLQVLHRGENDRFGAARWVCVCTCGNSVLVRGAALNAGKQISCGCIRNANNKHRAQNKHPGKKGIGVAALNVLYGSYKRAATRRKKNFQLTIEQFSNLIIQNCYYCGDSPHSILKRDTLNGEVIYNGIDRYINSLGYTIENCVTCCKTCNIAKHTKDGPGFEEWIRKVYHHRYEN